VSERTYGRWSRCFETVTSGASRCPVCGAEIIGAAPPTLRRAVQAATRDRETGEGLDEFQRQFRRQFEGRGIYIGESELRHAERILSNAAAELRKASVLFVDLRGFSKLGKSLSAERLGQMLEPYYRVCTTAVVRHRGFVVKLLGDGVLAVFGAPVAYDRDAESCVRAALEIRESAGELPPVAGKPVEVSIGVATGEVLSAHVEAGGRGAYDVVGAAVNLAQRLQSAAGPGEIVVCRDTHALVGRFFEAKKTRPLALKNVATRYVAFSIVGEAARSIARRAFDVPFCGRQTELAQLRAVLDEAEKGAFRVVHVVGEPGIGKSRLVAEALADRADRATVLRGECAPHGQAVLFYPILDWVRSLLGLSPGESAALVANKIARFVQSHDFLDDVDGTLLGYLFGLPSSISALVGLPVERIQKNLFAVLRRILEQLAARRSTGLAAGRPVILALDDLQWIDSLSRQWIEQLIEQRPPTALALILIYRSEGDLGWSPTCGDLRIRPRPLPQRHRMQFLQAILPLREFLPEIREAILSRSSGNPLFMEEMVKLVLEFIGENGANGIAQIRNNIVDVVPASLQQLIQSRIDKLSERTKAVLQCGAVLGQRFALSLIELFEIVREGLLEHLYTLKGLRFLEETRAAGDVEYFFVHSLTYEVAYSTLLREQRERLHYHVAERIERQFADRIAEFYDLLAYHYGRTSNHDKTVYYLIKSGDRSAAMNAAADAIDKYQQAVGWLREEEPTAERQAQLGRILVRMGRMHRMVGDTHAASAALSGAMTLAAELDNNHLATDAAIETGIIQLAIGRFGEATESFSRALALSRQTHQARAEAIALNSLGVVRWHQGHLEDALSYFHSVRALLKSHPLPAVEADVYNNAGLILWRWGQYAEALKNFRLAVPLRHQCHDRFGLVATLLNIGLIEEQFGRMRAAHKSYLNALGLAERLDFIQAQSILETNLSNLARRWGKPAEALDHAARSTELARRASDRRTEVFGLENLGTAYRALGNRDESRRHFDQALKLAQKIGERERAVSVRLFLAGLELDALAPSDLSDQSDQSDPSDPSDASTPTAQPAALLQRINALFRQIEKHGYRDLLPLACRTKARCLEQLSGAGCQPVNGGAATQPPAEKTGTQPPGSTSSFIVHHSSLEFYTLALEHAVQMQNVHEELESLEALREFHRRRGNATEAAQFEQRAAKIRKGIQK
jgi:class 3 adenylate cyclase/tetratricopeptide (TPR) repeat protein